MRGIFWGYVLAAAGFALSGWAGVPALLALCASGCVSANGCGGMTAESVRFGQARAAFLLTALCAAAGVFIRPAVRVLLGWVCPVLALAGLYLVLLGLRTVETRCGDLRVSALRRVWLGCAVCALGRGLLPALTFPGLLLAVWGGRELHRAWKTYDERRDLCIALLPPEADGADAPRQGKERS